MNERCKATFPGGMIFMMKKILMYLIVVLWLPCAALAIEKPFYGTVKKVIDGDSLLITAGKRNVEVRLYGIDAPEYDQPFAKEPKKFIRYWTGQQRVLVQPQATDAYGRTVAIIIRGEQVLNEDLVKAGMTWVYPRYCRKDICRQWKQLEHAAEIGKKGLWGNMHPIPPWKWKSLQKTK